MTNSVLELRSLPFLREEMSLGKSSWRYSKSISQFGSLVDFNIIVHNHHFPSFRISVPISLVES
ncbi:hypothetical protein [Nostoc sp.]|uniref:hypothetical protein n=1 Tax=Nostoc sp. TaxID=1180 RepID=UPI002FF7C62C